MLEQNLNELNIFALRDLARRTGVKSPTSKKKEELIEEIKEIISGKKQPTASKSKQGRPPKVFGYNFANVFNLNELNNSLDLTKQTLNQAKGQYESVEMVTVAGWLELVNNNSALLWVEKDFRIETYFIPGEVLNGLHVKMGDRVVAEVGIDENVKVVKKIFSINACPILQMPEKRIAYENIAHNLPSRKLEFNKLEYNALSINKGENIYFYGSNNNCNTVTLVDILNSCETENKLYINVSMAEKNKIFIKDLNGVEKFVVNITDEIDMAKRIVFLATERAKRILEEGEDVVVVVDDVASIAGVDKDGLSLIKNLVATTKEGKKHGSITLLAIIPNENFSQIEKLSDKRFKIVDDKILNLN